MNRRDWIRSVIGAFVATQLPASEEAPALLSPLATMLKTMNQHGKVRDVKYYPVFDDALPAYCHIEGRSYQIIGQEDDGETLVLYGPIGEGEG